MPLSDVGEREPIHSRVLDMRAFRRPSGLYDVECHMVDAKPFAFVRIGATQALGPGEPIHDLWLRLTVDDDFVLHAIEAASDVTPWAVCREATAVLQVLVGACLTRGFGVKVREHLRGAAGCTHMAEMLPPLASAALQSIYGLRPQSVREARVEHQVNSCHAFRREGDVIRRLAPAHHRPPGSEA